MGLLATGPLPSFSLALGADRQPRGESASVRPALFIFMEPTLLLGPAICSLSTVWPSSGPPSRLRCTPDALWGYGDLKPGHLNAHLPVQAAGVPGFPAVALSTLSNLFCAAGSPGLFAPPAGPELLFGPYRLAPVRKALGSLGKHTAYPPGAGGLHADVGILLCTGLCGSCGPPASHVRLASGLSTLRPEHPAGLLQLCCQLCFCLTLSGQDSGPFSKAWNSHTSWGMYGRYLAVTGT